MRCATALKSSRPLLQEPVGGVRRPWNEETYLVEASKGDGGSSDEFALLNYKKKIMRKGRSRVMFSGYVLRIPSLVFKFPTWYSLPPLRFPRPSSLKKRGLGRRGDAGAVWYLCCGSNLETVDTLSSRLRRKQQWRLQFCCARLQ